MAILKIGTLVPERLIHGFKEPDEINIVDVEVETRLSNEGVSLITLALEVTANFSAGVLAAWFYDVFIKPNPSSKPYKIKINEKVHTISTKDQLEQLIEREVTYREDD